jgi:hypothetical protein
MENILLRTIKEIPHEEYLKMNEDSEVQDLITRIMLSVNEYALLTLKHGANVVMVPEKYRNALSSHPLVNNDVIMTTIAVMYSKTMKDDSVVVSHTDDLVGEHKTLADKMLSSGRFA